LEFVGNLAVLWPELRFDLGCWEYFGGFTCQAEDQLSSSAQPELLNDSN
jgi:hypothetical protein